MYYITVIQTQTASEKLGVMLFGAKPWEKSEEGITELCEPPIWNIAVEEYLLSTEIISDYFYVSQ